MIINIKTFYYLYLYLQHLKTLCFYLSFLLRIELKHIRNINSNSIFLCNDIIYHIINNVIYVIIIIQYIIRLLLYYNYTT